jgi:hypothetical protein
MDSSSDSPRYEGGDGSDSLSSDDSPVAYSFSQHYVREDSDASSEWEQAPAAPTEAPRSDSPESARDDDGAPTQPWIAAHDHPLAALIETSSDEGDDCAAAARGAGPFAPGRASFDRTVVSVFRKLTVDFRNPGIALTLGEIFSLCIGAQYRSARGGAKAIRPTPIYFQRLAAAVERHCLPVRGKSGQFCLPDLVNDCGQIA